VQKFSFKNRNNCLKNLEVEAFDIAVVGGGITGAGVAREAALRGLKVCLLEKSDFSSGASSKSSKLAHGGLRYLENFEFDLVSEALNERQHLLRMAPHMVHPLPFLIPIYKDDRVGWLKMKAGMVLYDLLSAFRAPKLHRSISPSEIIDTNPYLKKEGLKGGFIYYDAYMDDDRLVLETLRSIADKVNIVSYCSVDSVKQESSFVTLDCQDQKTNKRYKVQAKHVISCVGPWTDIFGELTDQKWSHKMRPSKGVHLCINKKVLNLKTALVMAADKSKRILFCIPRKDFDIIGTTDTDYQGDLDKVQATPEDIEYIKTVLLDYFPKNKLKDEDILSTYAGVRPLIHDGSKNESKVSRNHRVFSLKDKPVTFISGGKYTTYLSMAIDAVEEATKKNKSLKAKHENIESERRRSFVIENTEENKELSLQKIKALNLDWSDQEIENFVDRHGAQSYSFIENNLGKSYLELEALVAIDEYCCGSLVDLYHRRTPWSLSRQYTENKDMIEVGNQFKLKLEWSDAFLNQEIESLQKSLRS
jgi:glycerol-3-phosphate dehydrogenase